MNWFARFFNRAQDGHSSLDNLTDESLRVEFINALNEYANQIDAKWTLDPASFADATVVSDRRSYLHDIVQEARKRNLQVNLKRLKSLDKEWQDWILKRIEIDFSGERTDMLNHQYSKEEWWWWIDRLDELSNEERSTV